MTSEGPASAVEHEAGGPAPSAGIGESASYLIARLQILESRVARLVAHRRASDPTPDDQFRGLYISDAHVDHILSEVAASRRIVWDDEDRLVELDRRAVDMEAEGARIRLRSLAKRAGLDGLDVDLLLVCLAPDLDSRFERLYGYLNDDVSRRRATVGLGLELAGASPWSAGSRARVGSGSPLVACGLLAVEDPERPLLSRRLRVPDRVVAYLLGDDRPAPGVADLLRPVTALPGDRLAAALGPLLVSGVELVYLRERPGFSGPATAFSALANAGRAAVVADLGHLGPNDDVSQIIGWLACEAVLSDAGIVAGPIEALLQRGPGAVRAFAALPAPVILHGRAGWDPAWSRRVPLAVDLAARGANDRSHDWDALLGSEAPEDLAGSDVATQFVLTQEQVGRAVDSARLQASLDGQALSTWHLRAGARSQNGSGLDRLARRIEPRVGWADLVLAPSTDQALHELAARARHRGQVLDRWGMRPGGGRGRGITVLFGGDSGTGKTMSAEVVAGELGLDLYAVNLATVVDKYVGETEKNLERIFTEADGVNAVLLFDEADALFGKRSEVRDANDRYANIEVAYLLQRMETFDGLAILATNLRANVDDAFARRLDMVIDFPTPDEDLRRRLWDSCLSPGVPRADDLDLDFCARAWELSGGNIRSIALTAAYMAAEAGEPVNMVDLVRAVQREYRKLGRLVVASEFGPYHQLVSGG